VSGLETYVKRMTSERSTPEDAEEIKRNFADDMRADLQDFRAELVSERITAIFSKEILVTALAAIGTVASWAFGAPVPVLGVITTAGVPVTIGGLVAAGNEYLSARRKIIKSHPMAYLYEMHR
jgi:hypothetical protein